MRGLRWQIKKPGQRIWVSARLRSGVHLCLCLCSDIRFVRCPLAALILLLNLILIWLLRQRRRTISVVMLLLNRLEVFNVNSKWFNSHVIQRSDDGLVSWI